MKHPKPRPRKFQPSSRESSAQEAELQRQYLKLAEESGSASSV